MLICNPFQIVYHILKEKKSAYVKEMSLMIEISGTVAASERDIFEPGRSVWELNWVRSESI